MATITLITDQVLEACINAISSKDFNTYDVIAELEKSYPGLVKRLIKESPAAWRSVVGRAIKKYSLSTQLVVHTTPGNVSPAWWEKI